MMSMSEAIRTIAYKVGPCWGLEGCCGSCACVWGGGKVGRCWVLELLSAGGCWVLGLLPGRGSLRALLRRPVQAPGMWRPGLLWAGGARGWVLPGASEGSLAPCHPLHIPTPTPPSLSLTHTHMPRHPQVRTASCGGTACVNSFGDEQLAVDMLADKLLFEALRYSGCCKLACSEEVPEPLDLGGEPPPPALRCWAPVIGWAGTLRCAAPCGSRHGSPGAAVPRGPPSSLPSPAAGAAERSPILLLCCRLACRLPCFLAFRSLLLCPSPPSLRPPTHHPQAPASPSPLTPWTAPPSSTPTSRWAPSLACGPGTS